jgi:hypothetical protein
LRLRDGGRGGDSSDVAERAEDHVEAEEVIVVPMGDVERREIFPGRPDLVRDLLDGLGREAGVDQGARARR